MSKEIVTKKQFDKQFPEILQKPNIYIDGDFNDSYESRVKRSKGKRKILPR